MSIEGNWRTALPAFADKVDRDILECVRKIANKKLEEVVAATPVKTGALRGNWNVGSGRKFQYKKRGDALREGKARIAANKSGRIVIENPAFYGLAVKSKNRALERALDFR